MIVTMDTVLLYIDPGTGSMLFTVLIGIVGFLVYFFRVLWVKIKFVVTRGKVSKAGRNKIPILIFAEAKRYWPVFEPICRELEKRGKDVVYWTTSPDDPALTQDKYEHLKAEFIGEGNKAYAKLNMVNACVLVSSTPGLDVYQWKRSKFVDHYLHVPHAANDIASYRMFGTDYYDSVLLSGQYQIDEIREMEMKRDLPAKELELAGIPYMDELRARIQENDAGDKDNTVVLLAPSWGDSSIFNRFGGDIIDRLIETGYDLIIRPHPQSFISDPSMMAELMRKYPESEHLKWDRNSDNFDSLNKADIMISDFSGIIFDFALAFDKPVIYADTEFNKDVYDYWWLDRTPWTEEILPSLGKKLTKDNFGNIKELIDSCIGSSDFREGREKARSEAWVNIGEGASRMAGFIAAKEESLTA